MDGCCILYRAATVTENDLIRSCPSGPSLLLHLLAVFLFGLLCSSLFSIWSKIILVVQISTSRETVIQEMVACAYEENDFDKLGEEKIVKARNTLRYQVSGSTFHAYLCSNSGTLNMITRIPKTMWTRCYAGVSCRFSPGSGKCGCNTACCSAIVNKAFRFVADKQQFCYVYNTSSAEWKLDL